MCTSPDGPTGIYTDITKELFKGDVRFVYVKVTGFAHWYKFDVLSTDHVWTEKKPF